MAKGNFDEEIKKGMATKAKPKQQQTNPASSTNDAPGNKPPANVGKFNKQPQPTNNMPTDMSQRAAPVDTLQAMHDAGAAHMAAIHAHIASLKG